MEAQGAGAEAAGPTGDDKTAPLARRPAHSAAPVPQPPELCHERAHSYTLPDHVLLKKIGGGGFGEVYLARNRHGGHLCAVKVVLSHAESELEGLRRFKERVSGHEHLIDIEHVGKADGVLYCVMPLADSTAQDGTIQEPRDYLPMTLGRLQRWVGRLPSNEVAVIATSIASGLAHMHRRGIAHGDVKPNNIFCVAGTWRLGDYGLAADPETHARGLTRGFVGPDGPGGPAADAYALGVTMLLLLSGQFAGDPRSLIQSIEERPDAETTRDVLDIARALVEPDPARRLTVQQAAEVLAPRQGSPETATGGILARSKPAVTRIALTLIGVAPPVLLLLHQRPPMLHLTVLAALVAGLVGRETALAFGRRGPFRRRTFAAAAALALGSWLVYQSAFDFLTHRTPDTWPSSAQRVYQTGFGLAPWSLTEPVRERIDAGRDFVDKHDLFMEFGYEGQSPAWRLWQPWSIVASAVLLTGSFSAGAGLWAAAWAGVGSRLQKR